MVTHRSAQFSRMPAPTTPPQWWRWLVVILVFLGAAGIWWQLGQPTDLVFDEHYHVPAARAVVQGNWRIFDWWQPPQAADGNYADWLHPPLFKYLQASAVKVFGDQSWAWRWPSAIAGLAVIGLSFGLGRQLSLRRSPAVGWLAAALTAMSGLVLVQARMGMNDMVLTMFGLGAVMVYSHVRSPQLSLIKTGRGWLLVTGLLVGLAAATKWTGWLLGGGLLGIELWHERQAWRRWPWVVMSLGLLPALLYVASFWPIFSTGRGWQHFIQLHQAIWQYQITRDRNQPDQSPAWQWPLNLTVVHYWQNEVTPVGATAGIFLTENPVLNLVLMSGVCGWGWYLLKSWRQRRVMPGPSWLYFCYLMLWLPLVFSPRILFQYHYLPAVPLAAILTAVGLERLWGRFTWLGWLTAGALLTLICITWILFYPHWTGLPVPLWLAHTIY